MTPSVAYSTASAAQAIASHGPSSATGAATTTSVMPCSIQLTERSRNARDRAKRATPALPAVINAIASPTSVAARSPGGHAAAHVSAASMNKAVTVALNVANEPCRCAHVTAARRDAHAASS